VALQSSDFDGLLIVLVHDAGTFAEHIHGHTREQLKARMLASRMAFADPTQIALAIFLMKRGTSMWVGQAPAHAHRSSTGQRFASTTAARGSKADGSRRSSAQTPRP